MTVKHGTAREGFHPVPPLTGRAVLCTYFEQVFERANALETASLVMENLLGVSECSTNNLGSNWGACGASSVEGALGEQRRFADVASDIARSRVFTSVLVETGRLAYFLRDAVAVFTRAAAEISANVDNGGSSPLTGREFSDASARWRLKRLEPLLRALCSFCLEHSPARSTFMQALLGPGRESATPRTTAKAGHSDRGTHGEACAAAAGVIPPATDPCKALFVLCLHPHPPTASAASALVQCLLVGGGALGAVSGPSPGAAAGVGVIPAAFHRFGCGGAWAGGGIGREDPIQAALLKKISDVALGGRKRQSREKTGLSGDLGGRKVEEQGEDLATDATSVADSSDCSGSEREVDDGWCGNRGLDEPIGLGDACLPSEESSSPAPPPGALFPVLRRLGRIGAGLASAQAKHMLGSARGETSVDRKRSAIVIGYGGWASTPSCDTGFGAAGGGLKARAVEAEQELTSILCLLSSLVSFRSRMYRYHRTSNMDWAECGVAWSGGEAFVCLQRCGREGGFEVTFLSAFPRRSDPHIRSAAILKWNALPTRSEPFCAPSVPPFLPP